MPSHAPLRRNLLALLVCAWLPSLAAAETAPAADAASATTLDSISVIGRGEARQVQRVTAEDMKILPPGANPLKLLASKPGVHFESADATGAYEWSTTISLRGFNQNRLGYTLDGIPLGNMAYGSSNGLHISRAVISENLGGPKCPPASVRLARRPPATSVACSSSIRSIRPPSTAWCWRRASAATTRAQLCAPGDRRAPGLCRLPVRRVFGR